MTKRKIAVAVGGKRNTVMFETISGIWKRAREDGADLYVFCCYGGSSEDPVYNSGEYNVFSLLHPEDYDGVIMVARNIDSARQREELAAFLKKSGRPAISIENDVEGMYFAGIDNYTALYKMTSHLIEKHHCETLSYIGGPDFDYENRERCRGFCKACTDHGIALDERRIHHYSWSNSDGCRAFHEFRNQQLLDADAYICANDDLAIGFINEAQAAGFNVPKDFLVTGFDCSPYANVFSPNLTTVDREKESAGYKACDLLLKAIGGIQIPHQTVLKSSCIFSESCGCKSRNTERSRRDRCQAVESVLAKDMLTAELNIMETVLTKCGSLEAYYHNLAAYVQMLHARAFYLMINESELRKTPGINTAYRNHGYDDFMYVSLMMENNEEIAHSGHRISTRSIVPSLLDGKSHMYLISPVHFQDRCMGYCVSVDSLDLIRRDRYFDWLNNLNTTLNIMHEKRLLQILNDKLNMLYMEDSMTGLYNRFGYSMKAVDIFRENEVNGDSTLVLFLDLNDLKMINDTYGHEHGDLALRTMADAIRACVPEGFIPVRYGGDEFLIIGRCNRRKTADDLNKALSDYLEQYNKTSKNPYKVTCSAGYTLAKPFSGDSLDSYVQQADKIMYKAKKKFKKNRLAGK